MMMPRVRLAVAAAAAALTFAGVAEAAPPPPAEPDAPMTLSGGEDDTELPSLTVKGENRIQIEFDRPELSLDLDPASAPGLEWGNPLAVLQRESIDLRSPYLEVSTLRPIDHLADPWAASFRTGTVARFRPELEGVAEWKLAIADSRSRTVAEFSGKGSPPDEIEWDGRCLDGSLASPALTYSYSLEAADKAGNRRNFVGPGFHLPAYRGDQDGGHAFLFTGAQLPDGWEKQAPRLAPTLLLEAATEANRRSTPGMIEVQVAAPTFAHADALAGVVADCLKERLLADPNRVRTVARAQPGAPPTGEIAIVLQGEEQ